MKTYFKYLLILPIVLLSISCDKEEENSEEMSSEEKTIYGKWSLIQSEKDGEKSISNECEKKSIVEFKTDNTYKDVRVIDEGDSGTCTYDGFGTTGTFVLTDGTLIRTALEVISYPERLNNPDWIENAKGEYETEIVSFEEDNLIISLTIQDGDETISFKDTYEKTTEDFFVEE